MQTHICTSSKCQHMNIRANIGAAIFECLHDGAAASGLSNLVLDGIGLSSEILPELALNTRAAFGDSASRDMALCKGAEFENFLESVIVRDQEGVQFELVTDWICKNHLNRMIARCLAELVDHTVLGRKPSLATWAMRTSRAIL